MWLSVKEEIFNSFYIREGVVVFNEEKFSTVSALGMCGGSRNN